MAFHPLILAADAHVDPTLAAAQTGDSMLAGSQNVPISELYGAYDDPTDGKAAITDPQQNVNVRTLSPAVAEAQAGPATPPVAPDRPAQFQRAFTFVRDWGALGYFTGQHGEVNPGAAQPPGLAAAGVPGHGNTWRLAPQPWDNGLWVNAYGGANDEGHGP